MLLLKEVQVRNIAILRLEIEDVNCVARFDTEIC